MEILTKKVSEIDVIEKSLSTDILLYSRPYSETDQTYYKDCVVDNQSLATGLTEGALRKLNLKSMAYEDKDSYSPKTHKHDYSKVSIESFNTNGLTIDARKESSGELSVLARINIDGKLTNINALGVINPDPPKIDIGTLMFVAYPTLEPIDENLETFDGYVYPDGRSIKKDDFKEAYEVFGDEYKLQEDPDDEFRIPILSDFISLNPMIETTECCRRNKFQNGIMDHTHEWQFVMEGKTKGIEIQVGVGGSNRNLGGIHRGNLESGTMKDHVTDAQVRLSSDNLRLESDVDVETNDKQVIETESTPDYMMLPVLMYIGKNSRFSEE